MEAVASFSTLETSERKSIAYTQIIAEQLYHNHRWVIGSLKITVRTFQVYQEMVHINKLIGSLEIETDDDRQWCQDRSEQLRNLSRRIDKTRERLEQTPQKFLFSSSTQQRLEDAACLAEDASETLALAASVDFKNALEQSLAAHGVS